MERGERGRGEDGEDKIKSQNIIVKHLVFFHFEHYIYIKPQGLEKPNSLLYGKIILYLCARLNNLLIKTQH